MNFTRISLTIFTFLIAIHLGTAQQERNKSENYKIIGQVLETSTQSGLEFATVSLFSAIDSSLITGSITDEMGKFSLDASSGIYRIAVEYIGYDVQYLENISVNKNTPLLNLNEIMLSLNTELIEGVEVVATKSQTIYKLDKRVFNVGSDLSNKGGTAEDILNNVPSVSVDIEGAVSLRGSEAVRILINGKPSGLIGISGQGGLRQIPANLIENIEVITNPSARYEAEGSSGIINIVLKRNKKGGINGTATATVGSPLEYRAGLNLNYRRDNINVFTNLDYGFRRRIGNGLNYQEFITDSLVNISDQSRIFEREGVQKSVQFGTEYFFNDKESLTGSLLYKYSNENNIATVKYADYENSLDNPISETTRIQNEVESGPVLEYNIDYRKEFETKGKELTASLKYSDNGENEDARFTENTLDNIGTIYDPILQRASNAEGENQWIAQLDFVNPFKDKQQLEMGFRSSIRTINNDYLVEEQQADGTYLRLNNVSNNFIYNEDIHAAYMIYGGESGKFSYQAGLRAEYSIVSTELKETNQINERDYPNLFPSASLSYKLNPESSFQVSYSRRIRRPRFRELNPFFTYADNRNFFSGNPNLDPELTNSFELAHIKYYENTTLSGSIYYRNTTDVIQWILLLQEDGTTLRQPQNFAVEKNYGLELNANIKYQRWLRINGSTNLFQQIVDGQNFNENFTSDAFTWRTNWSANFNFWDGTDLQLRSDYQAPRATTQGTAKSIFSLDIALSRSFLKKRLGVTFSLRDAFNSRRRRSEVSSEDFYSYSEFQWNTRSGQLSLSYKLNNNPSENKNKKSRNGGAPQGGGGDDF